MEPKPNTGLEHLRRVFENDRFATQNGMVIDSVAEESVVCGMEITDAHRNAAGGVQGGAIFTLADFAFAVHSNLEYACGTGESVTLAQSCSISFVKATKGRRLFAVSARISKGRSISVYSIRVKDDLGVTVAEMLANGYTIPKAGRN